MYGNQGQLDMYFMMLYGGVAMMAIMSCVYLLLRPVNVIVTNVQSPRELRLWAAAFLATMAGSHVWWILLGQVWLTDDQLVRILILIALDNMTLVPLIMATLLRLLQDRRRPPLAYLCLSPSNGSLGDNRCHDTPTSHRMGNARLCFRRRCHLFRLYGRGG